MPSIDDYTKRLDHAIAALTNRFAPERLDTDTAGLNAAFVQLYDTGIFALYRYDPALQEQLKFLLFSRLGAHSGSLAFLAVQILAANKIMHTNAFALKEHYFARRCGIAINHLRASFTAVSATQANNIYRLNGKLTWASGYGIFDTLVVGFHCDGEELQAVIPFEEAQGFRIGERIETFAADAMNTVDIVLEDFTVPREHIVASHPLGTYTKNKSVSKTVHYALYGIGLGVVSRLEDEEVCGAAASALEALKSAFLESKDGERLDALRVELFSTVQQIVSTGITLRGGGAVRTCESLQRYYRELVMFNANGLNTPLKRRFKNAFLDNLSETTDQSSISPRHADT